MTTDDDEGDRSGQQEGGLIAVQLDLGEVDPSGRFESGFVDGGSRETLIKVDGEPSVVSVGDDTVRLRSVAAIAPDLVPRVPAGFSTLAACSGVLVMVVDDPQALVGVDVSSGEVHWESALDGAPQPQITCGDTGVVLVQDDDGVRGIEATSGTELWQADLDPDDPLRSSPRLGLIGTYDGIVAIDPATGDQLWTQGESVDAVEAPASAGAVLRIGGSLVVVSPDGMAVISLSPNEVEARPYETLVARSGSGLALVDPDTAIATSSAGAVELLASGDVVSLVGAGPDGLVWAVVVGPGGAPSPALIDGDGTAIAKLEAPVVSADLIALPDALLDPAGGQAFLAPTPDEG